MEKGEEVMIGSEGGGCVDSRDNEDEEVNLVNGGVMDEKLDASKISRATVTVHHAYSWTSDGIIASDSMKSLSPRRSLRTLKRHITWSQATLRLEDEVTDIEILPSNILEDALERRLCNDGSWAIAPCKLTSLCGSEHRHSRLKGSFDQPRMRHGKFFEPLLERYFSRDQPTVGGYITSDIPHPILRDEIYNEPPDQAEESFVSENVLKNRITVDPSSGVPYIIPFPSVCDACEYCEDTCELEDCRDCLIKKEKSEYHQCYDQTLREFSTCWVRRHNRTGSAWLVCDNRIYDCTLFLEEHPGGKTCMLKLAGGENCMSDYDFHSKKAQKLWCSFYIGNVTPCPGHHRNTEHCVSNYPITPQKKGRVFKSGEPACVIS